MTMLFAYRRNERGGISALMIDRANWPPGDEWYDSPDKVPPADAKTARPVIEAPPPVVSPPQHPGQETHFSDTRSEGVAPFKRGPGRPPKHPRY